MAYSVNGLRLGPPASVISSPGVAPRCRFVPHSCSQVGGRGGRHRSGCSRPSSRRGIRPDAVYGASVGAVNAAGFVVNPTLEGVERMATIWRGLSSEDVFPHGRVPTPWRFLQQRESVHPNDGLRKIIEVGAGIERFEDACIRLEVVATSLTDGRAKWFSTGSVADAVLASAALPSLLPPMHIDGERLHRRRGGRQRTDQPRHGAGLHEDIRPSVRAAALHAVDAAQARGGSSHRLLHRRAHALRPRTSEPSAGSRGGRLLCRFRGPVALRRLLGTDALMRAGRSNAAAVLDFWESGGRGEIGIGRRDRREPPPPIPVEAPPARERESARIAVPAPPA